MQKIANVMPKNNLGCVKVETCGAERYMYHYYVRSTIHICRWVSLGFLNKETRSRGPWSASWKFLLKTLTTHRSIVQHKSGILHDCILYYYIIYTMYIIISSNSSSTHIHIHLNTWRKPTHFNPRVSLCFGLSNPCISFHLCSSGHTQSSQVSL